jgi:carbon storage regulator CsrA
MLALTRDVGESLILETSDDPIRVTLIKIDDKRSQGEIGIEAPQSVRILRDELIPDESVA